MAKQPVLKTISDGWYTTSDLNANFRAIRDAFENVLSRDARPFVPNYMEVDYDISDATITNVNRLVVQAMTVQSVDFTGFAPIYTYQLGILEDDLSNGSIVSHNSDGEPQDVPVGTNGNVLKISSSYPMWADDLDTIGITVMEDGVVVAENVTELEFIYPLRTIVTNPVTGQVDVCLTCLLEALWEDRTQADSNLDPSDDPLFASDAEVTRVDLIADVGLAAEPTADNQYYALCEASNYFEDSVTPGASDGTWNLGIEFFDNTGTSAPQTGNKLPPMDPGSSNEDVQGLTDGGNHLVAWVGIPANTRYVDFSWSLIPTFPLFLTYIGFSDRYRAIVSASQNDTFLTPLSKGYPGGVFPTVTPGP